MKKELSCIKAENIQGSPFSYTLSLIGGKYKMGILYALFHFKTVRYNELKRYMGSISFKSLSNALKELENDKLIQRKEYPQIPPKVEYSLSTKGQSLIPILDSLNAWGEKYYKDKN
ncbi:transcriptional regulator, HxlR family [Campylobacter avium LMG 24591]|uniref:Transcriptional regulator, HxlR family n=1 Tax=Campylobacter avium LMG 24591 TaxID=522484 RepID=A0A222N0D7_9BACT|nr:helix-turn-helix domain-containing protein [Campylobacter avium]ASQ31272.1 transcriptional regulator, HxlR family [Campylobacter avium LMG 24591]OYD79946.1 transcriptional regulator, HxlR family [Campylobacter avium]